jgi:hypothetical protein
MKTSEAEELINSILSNDIKDGNKILKELSNYYRYKTPEVLAKSVIAQMTEAKNLVNDPERLDQLLRLANLAVWSKTAKENVNKFYEIMLLGLQNNLSGKVRQSARALCDNYAHLVDETQWVELLRKIESMIIEYSPKNLPIYVDTLSPSVYKSLVLTWHDVIMKNSLWEKLNYLERMATLDIPCFKEQGDEEDDAPDEQSYDREDWKDCIEDFILCDDWTSVKKLLERREEHSISLLSEVIDSNDIKMVTVKHLVSLARSSNPRQLSDELLPVAMDIQARYEEPRDSIILRTDSFARAVQSLDNNAVVFTKYEKPFSRLISSAAESESWRTKRRFIELLPLLKNLDKSHDLVDQIITKTLIPADEKFAKFCEAHNVVPEKKTDFTRPNQVAHYILDWLIQLDYGVFFRRTPREIAAVSWHLFGKYNPEFHLLGLENRQLAEFGGWKNTSGLCTLSIQLKNKLDEGMADPAILNITDPEAVYVLR